jgi:hypothetical protein
MTILYYLISAQAGHEVASFNLAFICEQQPFVCRNLIKKDCIITYFNQSIVDGNKNIKNGYAFNKMGDYYFNSYKNSNNLNNMNRAIEMYANAFKRGETQVDDLFINRLFNMIDKFNLNFEKGLFNLALLIQDEGITLPYKVWNIINLEDHSKGSKNDQLSAIYKKY